jgi:hypothetical protein
MTNKNIGLIFLLIAFCIFSGCYEPEFETDIRHEGYVPIFDPLDDDPTAVGNFETSKFDGFWQVTNLEIDMTKPPLLTHPSMIYIFRENTIQRVAGTRDWYINNDNMLDAELSEINISWPSLEFMYSNTAIYEHKFREYDFFKWRWEWFKTNYEISTDGMSLWVGRDHMVKIDVEPWTKEDIISYSWQVKDIYNNDDEYDEFYLITFTENEIIEQYYINEFSNGFDTMNIPLSSFKDDYFTFLFYDIDGLEHEFTIYYYIIDDKLILNNPFFMHDKEYGFMLFSDLVYKRYKQN